MKKSAGFLLVVFSTACCACPANVPNIPYEFANDPHLTVSNFNGDYAIVWSKFGKAGVVDRHFRFVIKPMSAIIIGYQYHL